MSFDQFNTGRRVAGLAVSSRNRLDLPPLTRCGDSFSASIGRAPNSSNHAENFVLISNCIAETLEHQHASSLAHDKAVRTGIKRRGVRR